MAAGLFFSLLLSFASSAWSGAPESVHEKAKQLNLAQDPQWLRLLHFESRIIGADSTDAVGVLFFLTPERSSDSELRAMTDALYEEPKLEGTALLASNANPQPTVCRFPARSRFLRERLGLDPSALPGRDCSRFEKFREALGAQSVSLIFSSYYLNNPSSAFGHTFLRVNKAPGTNGKRNELLDYGLNYAAVVTTENALLYAFNGLFGLFDGNFTSVPYYYKVREYNDAESRDLWEYELALTEDEVRRLIEHVWELGTTAFPYYYLKQNCSYHMLGLLDAAAPRLGLLKGLKPIVLPADTVRVVNQIPGLVRAIEYRPSVRSQFELRRKGLSSQEAQALDELVSGALASDVIKRASLTDLQKVHVLDAAADWVDFKFFRAVVDQDPQAIRLKAQILKARAEVALQSEPLDIGKPIHKAPHVGHDSMRFSVLQNAGRHTGTELAFRFALHEALDSRAGHSDEAQIQFFSVGISKPWQGEGVRITRADIVEILSVSPQSAYSKSLSWHFRLGSETLPRAWCENCFGSRVTLGGGWTAVMGEATQFPHLWLAGLLELESAASGGLNGEHFTLGAGPTVIALARFSDRAAWEWKGRYSGWLGVKDRALLESKTEFRYGLSQNLATGLGVRYQRAAAQDDFAPFLGGFVYF